jgi:hypothetical protein
MGERGSEKMVIQVQNKFKKAVKSQESRETTIF